MAPPAATGLGRRLFWPQRHRTPGRRPDRGAVQFGAGLGNALLHPGRDEGHWPVRRQRVNPEIPVLAAAAATATTLLQNQAPVIVTGRWPVVHAGGGRAAAIGIQNAQPQLVVVPRGAAPGPMPFEGIGVARPAGLSLAAQADMEGELEPVRVGADTADRYSHLLSADQHHLCRDRRGDHRIRTHPGRAGLPDWLRWRRPRDRFKKAHAIRLTPFTAIREPAATAHSRRRQAPIAAAVLGAAQPGCPGAGPFCDYHSAHRNSSQRGSLEHDFPDLLRRTFCGAQSCAAQCGGGAGT